MAKRTSRLLDDPNDPIFREPARRYDPTWAKKLRLAEEARAAKAKAIDTGDRETRDEETTSD